MGDSMYIPLKNPRLVPRVVTFLDKYTPLAEKEAGLKDIYPYWWGVGSKVAFEKYSNLMGLDRELIRAVCCFVALKAGRRQASFPVARPEVTLSNPVPYIRYADEESWPVLTPDHWPEEGGSKHWCVDDLGLRPDVREYTLLRSWFLMLSEDYESAKKKYGSPASRTDPEDWSVVDQEIAEAVAPLREAMLLISKAWVKEFG